MTNHLVISVVGTPAPQGSKKHVGKGVMIESSKKVKPWRQDVKAAAAERMEIEEWETLDGPIDVHMTFYLPRPASAPKKIRLPWKKPDIDKLVRSTFDALSEAGVWVDDARVTDLRVSKRFVSAERQQTGALIYIASMNEEAF